jgi:DNA-binding NarL/FixJ family response regulator
VRLDAVQELRVVLMDMSPMLRDILRALVAGERDLRVAAEYDGLVPLMPAVEEHDADVVVFGDLSPRLDDECRELLQKHPQTKLFVVGGDGRRTTLYELRPYREHLGEVAPDELLAAMRNAGAIAGW